MAIFTKSGLTKLATLQSNIEQILHSPIEQILHSPEVKSDSPTSPSSDYSKKMCQNVLQLIDLLKNSNDLTSISDELKKQLKPLILHIDGNLLKTNTPTGIPAVFNDESAKLAEVFIQFLKSIDVKKDLGSDFKALIAVASVVSKATPKHFLERYILECEAPLEIYKIISTAKQDQDKSAALQKKVELFFSKEMKEGFLNKLPALKSENFTKYPEFLTEYQKNVDAFIKEALEGPYSSLSCDFDAYINAEKPYNFDINILGSLSLGKRVFDTLYGYENTINKELPEDKQVHYFRDEAAKIFTAQKVDAQKQMISALYAGFAEEKTSYDNKNHLYLFQSVDPAKKQFIQAVHDHMQKEIAAIRPGKNSLNESLLNVFKTIYINGKGNLSLCVSNNLSIGKCGETLRKYQTQILDLLLKSAWGHDERAMYTYHLELTNPAAPAAKALSMRK